MLKFLMVKVSVFHFKIHKKMKWLLLNIHRYSMYNDKFKGIFVWK